jgi:hypothetical protein
MKYFFQIIFICLCSIITAQKSINLSFEYKGKPDTVMHADSSTITFNINGKIVKPLIYKNSFVVPSFDSVKYVDVYIKYKRRTLLFSQVYTVKFDDKWIIGIDKKPFHTDVRGIPIHTKWVHYIIFMPSDSDGTVETVEGL